MPINRSNRPNKARSTALSDSQFQTSNHRFHEEYSVYTVIRNPSSPAGMALAERRAQVVRSDLTAPSGVEAVQTIAGMSLTWRILYPPSGWKAGLTLGEGKSSTSFVGYAPRENESSILSMANCLLCPGELKEAMQKHFPTSLLTWASAFLISRYLFV